MTVGTTKRLWQEANKERIRKHNQEYYLKNKIKIDARNAQYALENRGKTYEQQRRWRERKRLKNLANRSFTHFGYSEWREKQRFGGLRERVIQRDGEKCVDCGLSRKEHFEQFGVDITVDHENGIGRDSEQPDNSLANLKTRCLRCHGKKDQRRMKNYGRTHNQSS